MRRKVYDMNRRRSHAEWDARRVTRLTAIVLSGALACAFAAQPVQGRMQQPPPAGSCQLTGRASAGTTPLPGVAVLVLVGGAVKAATSTDTDGTYRLTVPAGRYELSAELTGFDPVVKPITMGEAATPCRQAVDFQLSLAPRVPRAPAGSVAAAPAPANAPLQQGRGAPPAAGAAAGAQRFATLNVQTQAAAAAGIEDAPDNAARLLLPPGFSTEGPTQALAVNGNMASLDRGMLNDRLEAIGRGEFNPATGEFGEGFGPGGRGGFGGPGGQGGPGGFGGGRGGPGGRDGGPGGFVLGGRGRSQNAYNLQSNYSFAGSPLDSAPYQLSPGSDAQQRPYSRQTFGVTVGGPVRIKGLYKGDRRTNFIATYSASRGGDLFDQYATVPSLAMRDGDFSASAAQLIDPATGLPFARNQIPAARMNAGSVGILRFVPLPNLEGDSRNFHYVATNASTSDGLSLRVAHNFTPNAGGRGAGGRGGGGGGRGGFGGPGGFGRGQQQGTSVNMTAQLQYRKTSSDQNNVFPLLAGETTGSSLAVPVTLNIQHKRTSHTITANYSRTASDSLNQYAFVEDVAGGAGIGGVSTDPFDWGVPQLSFSSFSSVRDVTPARRTDTRLSLAYGWTRPITTRHTLRFGGDVRLDHSDNQTDANARGAFVFTGLYSSGGSLAARGGGLDFADFLLGLPQQATVQYGPGNVRMSGRSLSAYVQDDWRRSSTLTFNLGVRYELIAPFYERSGQMANLDVSPGFTAAVPVISGQSGPFHGAFPKALLDTDTNNIAPRIGVAWRFRPGTILRGGYGVSYNSGSYSTIARQLAGQPPFATTNNAIGTPLQPLALSDPFAGTTAGETTNNYGVDPRYALGLVQTWNADFSRDIRQVWNLGAGYTETRGSTLDIVRAPNRGPLGLRIDGVQPFLWQTSEGSSVLHAATFRASRRPVKGIGGGVTYTLAKSRDNASSIGGGGTSVAQDDQNLAAEWGLSSFDRRHQLSTNLSVELPFGPNRRWFAQPGMGQTLFRDWRFTSSYVWQSGTPLTPRVTGAVADVARGTNGTLRANYNGETVALSNPTIDKFFNTDAFTIPTAGTFGTASRNMIIGPGSRQLNAQFSRDLRLNATRVVSVQLNATNLLNQVNYLAVDTVVNSPTFGQVLSVRGMRSMQVNLRFRF
jgi:hypothetical protein